MSHTPGSAITYTRTRDNATIDVGPSATSGEVMLALALLNDTISAGPRLRALADQPCTAPHVQPRKP